MVKKMKIEDYFTSGRPEHWLREIGHSDWTAGQYLHQLLGEHRFHDLLGEKSRLLLLTEGDHLVAFCTYAQRDEIPAEELRPWAGFVYTSPQYRGKRRMGKLLEHMEKAGCLMAMAEQGGEGYSGRRGYSHGYAGDGYRYSGGNMGYSHADGQNYNEGYSERMRAANGQYRPGENYSGHSIEDRMIADMESMAGRAGNDYERKRIQEGIEALRRVFN
jgi:hypothetical protein